ncbi:hypothetical protein ACFL96_10900 [Thermoproteota archaeon]
MKVINFDINKQIETCEKYVDLLGDDYDDPKLVVRTYLAIKSVKEDFFDHIKGEEGYEYYHHKYWLKYKIVLQNIMFTARDEYKKIKKSLEKKDSHDGSSLDDKIEEFHCWAALLGESTLEMDLMYGSREHNHISLADLDFK